MIRVLLIILVLLLTGCKQEPEPEARWALQTDREVILQPGEKDVLNVTSFQYTPEQLLVVDLAYGRQAFVFDQQGALLFEVGQAGQGPGEFQFPGGIYRQDGVIRLGIGNRQQNLYDDAGNFLKKVDVPNFKEPAIFCAGPQPGSVFGSSFSRYAKSSIYLMNKDGEIGLQFSPVDEAYGNYFDNLHPYGGIFRKGDSLVQYFNHRYELIFWGMDGIRQKTLVLESRKYVPPDYDEVVQGVADELKLRLSFTLVAAVYPWKEGYVSILRDWSSKEDFLDTLELWDGEGVFLGRMKVPKSQELVGVTHDHQFIFFVVEAETSKLIFRHPKKLAFPGGSS